MADLEVLIQGIHFSGKNCKLGVHELTIFGKGG